MLNIYCDGASRKDGRGGWGLAAYWHDKLMFEECGGAFDTTNNRMELQGAIEALKCYDPGTEMTIHSDSQYVVQGILEHIDLWLRTGWRTSGNNPVKNQDLWEELATLDVERKVTWLWVKGHSGVPGNERADALATLGVPTIA